MLLPNDNLSVSPLGAATSPSGGGKGSAAPHPNTFPRGEGAPVRKLGRMRNGDMFHICMHFVKKVHWKSLYRLN